jgi:hypothetical protein
VSAKLLRGPPKSAAAHVIGDLSRDGSGGQIHDGGALGVTAENHSGGRAVRRRRLKVRARIADACGRAVDEVVGGRIVHGVHADRTRAEPSEASRRMPDPIPPTPGGSVVPRAKRISTSGHGAGGGRGRVHQCERQCSGGHRQSAEDAYGPALGVRLHAGTSHGDAEM